MNFLMTLFAESPAPVATFSPETGAQTAGAGDIMQWLILIVPLVLMYVILIVPQKRRDKKMRNLINSAIVGDQIVTIGGLCGKIVNIKDDEITFESSIERSKITVKKWAIKEVKKPIEA